MKLKLSHKDYLLALGIAVAAVIMLTTLVYTEMPDVESKNAVTPAAPKTSINFSPKVVLKKALEVVPFKTLTNKQR